MPTAMVTFNGRITLPSDVRKVLKLRTGDSVDFVEIEKGRFAIVPGPVSIEHGNGWCHDLSSTSSEEEANT